MIRKTKLNGRELTLELRDEADESVFREIFLDKDYRTVDQIIITAKHPILDIGAHAGLFSLYAATLNPHTTIHAFEPEEKNYQQLKDHLKNNGIKNVQTKRNAVSSKEGEQKLNVSPDSHNHSLLTIDDQTTTQTVTTTTLEKFLAKNNIAKISLAKIDCEGAEFEIILNSPDEVLKKIDNFYIEYHIMTPEMQPQKIIQKLQKLGYKTKISPSSYSKNLGMILATIAS